MELEALANRLADVINDGSVDAYNGWCKEVNDAIPNCALCELDWLINEALTMAHMDIDCKFANDLFEFMNTLLSQIAPLIRYFRAFFPADGSYSDYRKKFRNIADRVESDDVVSWCNSFLMEYGMAAVPDLFILAKRHQNTKLYEVVWRQIEMIWRVNCWEFKCEALDNDGFRNLALGYLKEAFELCDPDEVPECLQEAPTVHLDEVVAKDVQMLTEKYEGEELEQKLLSYNEKQLDNAGMYHIMANIMQEGALCMESYLWCRDMFEDIGDRCERESRYLSMCEASYRATGKRPRYISNTYDLDGDSREKKKSEDWINPPTDEKLDPVEIPDPPKKKKEEDEDPFEEPKKKEASASTIYNITYQNSFNRHSNQRNTTGSYNGSRINSDNIEGGSGSSEDDSTGHGGKWTLADWKKQKKFQKKVVANLANKKALTEPPADLKASYLRSCLWTKRNLRNMPPWVLMLDAQEGAPEQFIQYRKYLAKKMIDLATEREIEYDGNIIVAGDPTDQMYDIEIDLYNDEQTIAALRKVANTVLNQELKKLSAPKPQKPNTGVAKVNEALELFREMEEFEEEIKGGDPDKDRPLGQRVYNRVQEFNVKAQGTATNVDQGLRQAGGIASAAIQTPMQLINVVKNFISDMKNRREQDIKEMILKDKKTRLNIYGMMRSLIKTALPWAILGPLWGTLFNMVALPVRGVKSLVTGMRGGVHRDLMIEMREEIRAEISIIDDQIAKAEAAGDHQLKYKLTRERSRMEQEYLKLASKIHFEPSYERLRNRMNSSPQNA